MAKSLIVGLICRLTRAKADCSGVAKGLLFGFGRIPTSTAARFSREREAGDAMLSRKKP